MARKRVGDSIEQTQLEQPKLCESASDLDVDFASLEKDVKDAYEQGVTMEEAERLAAKALNVQIKIARELAATDLDARMKKNGLKAVRARTYINAVNGAEKKPTEGQLEHTLNENSNVREEQELFDRAESRRDSLTAYLGIFKDAHIYFRGIAKGRFDG